MMWWSNRDRKTSPTSRSLPALRLLLLHDDPEREFAYTAGAERALEAARARGWPIVRMHDDWRRVFPDSLTG